ncbi:MAG TPA: NYN domain-containing protein [Candidatus Dormibacteraeota bacterium]|jgi:predicted RNA-binding protein with PIN domain|nr:NYN domain-containing protein [Candidatus Dormibacteraeota bacterium]
MRTLIVDGYNTVHAWPSLKAALESRGLEEARRRLVAALAEYAATEQVRVTVVFDAPRHTGRAASLEVIDGVEVRFSGGHDSADHVIERLAYLATRGGPAENVVVATSDRLQRDMVRAMGVTTMDARTLEAEVRAAADTTTQRATHMRHQAGNSRRVEHHLKPDVRDRLERMRRGLPADPADPAPPPDDTA